MFSYSLPERWEQARVALYDETGRSTGPLDPWSLLPVEFFRVVSIIDLVFLSNADERLRDEFCDRALRFLNTRPWRDFDEVRAAMRPTDGLRFAALDVYLVEVDLDTCDPTDRSSVLSAALVHRHDPHEVVGQSEPRWRFARQGGEDDGR
ncbi:hypothetical protein ALI22I_09595 [Saccharothrix sp. ALI-22-I]|uniref:hypothetical protein n=1 Tax=Saccharothrix sp. ALI-22-I TaxID=1933778 RepID=UPI00097CBD87|nr:hypothetical protein [Saccharothrix sp. ALI-22-I]ONI91303.1 hypothetical protein ALI22I_09595 [Saccharothrix sp. ALI-22-I]